MDPSPQSSASRTARPFLGVRYIACGSYGRLYLNADGSAYAGRCPKCGAPVRVLVGDHGTRQRFFQAVCPHAR